MQDLFYQGLEGQPGSTGVYQCREICSVCIYLLPCTPLLKRTCVLVFRNIHTERYALSVYVCVLCGYGSAKWIRAWTKNFSP